MGAPERPCEAVAASLAALTLGAALDPEEQALALEHLALCEACRRRLDEYAAVAQRLPLAAPEAEPPPELRSRILAAAAHASASPRAPDSPPAAPWRAAPRPWRRMLGPAMALIAAALVILSIAQGLMIYRLQTSIEQQRAQSAANGRLVVAAFGNADALEATLVPPDGGGYASARVFISPGEPAVALYARELPQLSPEQTYQLWIVHDGRTVAAGTFAASEAGRAWRALGPPETLGAVERVFVTVEPATGSQQPSGTEVLSGTAVPAIP
jgi:anti-sigma-K factor RskA